MKTLSDIKQDMSDLYDQVRDGTVELKSAAELANIAGKYLKAEQLELAREIFIASQGRPRITVETEDTIEGVIRPKKLERAAA
jgi:hypothetical protein